MSPVLNREHAQMESFPRVSGDEPDDGGGGGALRRFSPRERG